MRLLGVLVLALSLLGGLGALAAPPAQAAYSVLCTGWTGCKAAGFSTSGYQSASKKMWWRMYSGHNCTNYVAFRMVKAGLPNTRPWTSTGMAYNWGRANKSRTDQVPTVGSVAWWDRNAGGVGSSGHVAYVEQVVSSTEIVISEDSWSGDFHWRRITTTGRGWPSGFIHFTTSAVTSTAAPTVAGAPQVGATLTASPGTWSTPASYVYQWLASSAPIAGATGPSYVVTPDRVGQAISVQVTATRSGYAAGSATSAPTAPIGSGTLVATTPPAVTGTPQVDSVLTAAAGAWNPAATATTVQWQANGVDIPGATGWTLALGQAQAGAMVRAVVTGTRPGYAASAVPSAAVGPVLAPPIVLDRPFAITGKAKVGSSVSVSPGAFTPTDATPAYAWLRGGTPIPGATGSSYVLTAADVGSKPTVRVTVSRPGFGDNVSTPVLADAVTIKPTLTLATGGKGGRAVVIVRVAAAGVSKPGGQIRVSLGKRSAPATVVDGRATVVLDSLPAGTWKVVVTYAGDGLVRKAKARAKVTVTR